MLFKNSIFTSLRPILGTGLISWSFLLALPAGTAVAQQPFSGLEHLFKPPQQYTVSFAATAPVVDGKLDDQVWQHVPWTSLFTDIEGDKQPAPYYPTRLKMTWDQHYLYVAAEITDPGVWANVKHHDEVIFQDNDFEVFIDPDNNAQGYYEIEVNAINTIWDLFLPKAYRNGGDGLSSWEARGLKSAVSVQGTLNHPGDKDKGWTVELAIPYTALGFGKGAHRPQEGDFWRINFSRVQWGTHVTKGQYVKKKDAAGKDLPEHNWVWSPQGIINMHYPERWGYLWFSETPAGKAPPVFELPYAEMQRKYLWLVYYRQKAYLEKNGHYALTLDELGISSAFDLGGRSNQLTLEAGRHQFYLQIVTADAPVIAIDQDGLIQISKP